MIYLSLAVLCLAILSLAALAYSTIYLRAKVAIERERWFKFQHPDPNLLKAAGEGV